MSNVTKTPESANSISGRDRFAKRVLIILFLVVTVVLLIHFLLSTAEVILLLFISVLLAVLLRTLTNFLGNHTKLPDKVAFGVVLIALVALIVLTVMFLGPRIAEQADQLRQQLPEALERVEDQIREYSWGDDLLADFPRFGILAGVDDSSGINLFARLTGAVSIAVEALGLVLVVTVTAIYLAVEPTIYVDCFVRLIPKSRRDRVRAVLTQCYEMLRQWLITRSASMALNGVLTFVGLSLLGMPFALTLALLDALFSFVPTVGPVLALIPALLIAFLQGPQMVIYVVLVYLIVEAIDNYLVSPLLQRFILYIPPGVILAAQILLAFMIGRIGLIVAAPLVAVLIPIVRMLYVEDLLGDEEGTHGKDGEPRYRSRTFLTQPTLPALESRSDTTDYSIPS